ncbi:MAG: hypothetical protein IJ937_03415 [Treponema sp.]|nr:hypothetical protein [Treponema sp.]MBR2106298.1 hypothetical protein [Treponema sp.]
MISEFSTSIAATDVLVMEKTKEQKLSPRILELRKKIYDQEYLDNAIQRIAQVISGKLIETSDELYLQQ